MNKNKGDAGNIAGFTNLEHKLTMENFTPNTKKIQPQRFTDAELEKISRREILESTKLSRSLFGDVEQKLPRRESRTYNDAPPPVVVAVCAGCGARLDLDDQIQMKFSGCRKCISVFAKIDAACEKNEKRTRRELLEKMMRGEK